MDALSLPRTVGVYTVHSAEADLPTRTSYRLKAPWGTGSRLCLSSGKLEPGESMWRQTLSLGLCLLAALIGPPAAFSSPRNDLSGARLLKADEGLILVNTAWEQREQARRKLDCSHFVHQVYELSGFPYPYASSFDLYDGIDSF